MVNKQLNMAEKEGPQFEDSFLNSLHRKPCETITWSEEQKAEAEKKVVINSQTKVSDDRKKDLEENAGKYWDSFYLLHDRKFFKDRTWLFTLFPELDLPPKVAITTDSTGPEVQKTKLKIFEIGCGVGNTVFPILRGVSPDAQIFIYASDFSEVAINILKKNSQYDPSRCLAFVCDVTAEEWNPPFEEESLDIVVLIFALSSINPEKFSHVVKMIKRYLAPGGKVLFRDYGRYDMAQLRFKNGKCISDNFYVRGDNTRAYFFTQEELRDLFVGAGFIEEQNVVDKNLQVNSARRLKMYRVWIHAKFKKPIVSSMEG